MMMTKLTQTLRTGSQRRPADRRGVLLLVVLGMLAMFGLIGLAFVMLTGHARRGAEALRRKEFYAENHQKFTQEALLQILRGSNNPTSVLQNHGLLEDVYGNDTAGSQVTTTLGFGGQLMYIAFNPSDIPPLERVARIGRVLTFTSGPAAGQSVRIVDYDNTNGFRVVSPTVEPQADDTFIINGAAFSGTGFGYNINAAANTPQLSAQYTNSLGGNNWLPWSTSWTPSGTGPSEEPLQALFPNPVAYNVDYFAAADAYTDPSGPGGANEDYDAPDYQNMLLACQEVDGDVLAPSLHRPSLINFWHNKIGELIDITGMTGTPDQPMAALVCPHLLPSSVFNGGTPDIQFAKDLLSRISLRPSPAYHPNFTGSNPNYWPLWDGTAAYGSVQLDLDPGQAGNEVDITLPEWDVDNDGDGIKDSIWVDLGLPVQTSKDGRQYKPLVAILCVDLDGRLNLNAHGTLADALDVAPGDCDDGSGIPIAGGAAPSDADRGQGTGTVEVSLTNVLGASGATSVYAKLLRGDETNQIPGRYGGDSKNLSANGGDDTTVYTPSNDYIRHQIGLRPNTSTTAITVTDPPYDFRDYPYNYFTESGGSSLDFGSPVDLKGSMQVALDHRGQPIYQIASNAGVAINLAATPLPDDALIAQPYELDLSPHGPRGANLTTPDAPYSPSELERLLRPYDVDAMNLPNRLEKLADINDPTWWQTNDKNRKVTTESWDIASVPCAVTPADLTQLTTTIQTEFTSGNVLNPERFQRDPENPDGIFYAPSVKRWLNQFPPGVAQLLVVKLEDGGMRVTTKTSQDGTSIEENFATIGEDLLGPELMAGLPLNLNRKLTNTTERLAMARQLYCLAMLLADTTYLDTVSYQIFGATAADPKYTSQLLAQWAVNVVDFRCNNSIMTGFEYDQAPFVDNSVTPDSHPWDIDNNIGTDTDPDRAAVWGATRPDLLVTETLAFHDRRTEDLTSDPSGKNTTTSTPKDEDYDQQHRPQGSLFIEIYNPSSANEVVPNDLADTSKEGIDLGKIVGGSPVWRIAVVTETDNITNSANGLKKANLDPDVDPLFDNTTGNIPNPIPNPIPANLWTVQRSIYFVEPSFAGAATDHPEEGKSTSYYSSATAVAPLKPGRYAVVGPPNERTQGTFISTKDGDFTATTLDVTRRIFLDPKTTADTTGQVEFYPTETTATANDEVIDSKVNNSIQPPIAIVVDTPRRISVSEPTGGYELIDPDGNAIDATTHAYATPWDTPQDRDKQPTIWEQVLRKNGTVLRFAVLHLQRLADPTQAFNSDTNPYRTIDSMTVDLTTFNGITNVTGGTGNGREGDSVGVSNKFFTRERGENNNTALWAREPWGNSDTPTDAPNTLTPATIQDHTFNDNLDHSLGFLNNAFGAPQDTSTVPLNYVGSPTTTTPFSWLNWNNRPYMSKEELLMVPYGSSSQLLQSFTIGAAESYASVAVLNTKFTHLPNFLNSSANPGSHDATELQRVLDYVRVPSRFVRTRAPIMGTTTQDEEYREITDRREPGRVNLNTVNDANVWNGITNVGTMPGHTWDPANYPTQFPNPYRSAKGLTLVPTQQLMDDIDREVNATLLRENSGVLPLAGNTSDPYNDASRNPYFRYLPLTRLGNTAGTRSNVYAVWVTVGYFEVEPATLDDSPATTADELARIYPDGVMIGQEMGADSGEVERNRAFFMIDRSIPVGFQRGMDLNVKDAVLIEREIE